MLSRLSLSSSIVCRRLARSSSIECSLSVSRSTALRSSLMLPSISSSLPPSSMNLSANPEITRLSSSIAADTDFSSLAILSNSFLREAASFSALASATLLSASCSVAFASLALSCISSCCAFLMSACVAVLLCSSVDLSSLAASKRASISAISSFIWFSPSSAAASAFLASCIYFSIMSSFSACAAISSSFSCSASPVASSCSCAPESEASSSSYSFSRSSFSLSSSAVRLVSSSISLSLPIMLNSRFCTLPPVIEPPGLTISPLSVAILKEE